MLFDACSNFCPCHFLHPFFFLTEVHSRMSAIFSNYAQLFDTDALDARGIFYFSVCDLASVKSD